MSEAVGNDAGRQLVVLGARDWQSGVADGRLVENMGGGVHDRHDPGAKTLLSSVLDMLGSMPTSPVTVVSGGSRGLGLAIV